MHIVTPSSLSPRIKFGTQKLVEALSKAGYKPKLVQTNQIPSKGKCIIVGESNSSLIKHVGKAFNWNANVNLGKEGFQIATINKDKIVVVGADASGVLYGCLELADQVKTQKKLPNKQACI